MWMFQIAMMLLAVFMLYVLRIHRRQRHLQAAEFRVWVVIWLAFIVLVWFPGILQDLTETIHFSRVFDLLLVVSMVIMITVTVAVRLEIAQLRRRFEIFVVETAKRQVEINSRTRVGRTLSTPYKVSRAKTQRKTRGE